MSEASANVLYLNRPKRFSLLEARQLLPQVREITQAAAEDAYPILSEMERSDLTEEERVELNDRLQDKTTKWATLITRLGAIPKGLWLVDFDSGNGFYCWRFDEQDLSFFHSYEEGFSGRIPIQ